MRRGQGAVYCALGTSRLGGHAAAEGGGALLWARMGLGSGDGTCRLRSVPAMEYCSALKRNGILMHATKGMNLENILPAKMSPSPKGEYYVAPHL